MTKLTAKVKSKPKTKALNKALVMSMLPTDKDAEHYANGAFGFESDSYDKERAFMSGVDWMRNELSRKLEGNYP